MNDTRAASLGGSDAPTSVRRHIAAQGAIESLLRAEAALPRRSSAATLFGSPLLTDESRARYDRVVAALAIGSELDLLGGSWSLLNAVPLGHGHPSLDHLVIGPGGVFAITIAARERNELWNAAPGARRLGVRASVRESEFAVGAVERRLGLLDEGARVCGVIVPIEQSPPIDIAGSPDLRVVQAGTLGSWLLALPAVLSPDDVERIVGVAGLDHTWDHDPAGRRDGAELLSAFEALRVRVESAARRHRLWLIGLTASLSGLVTITALGVLGQTGALG